MSSNRSAELDAVVPANLAADVAAEWALCGDPLVGQLVGPYLVTRKLGEGGMGAVYEVVHRSLQRKAAMKVLRAHHAHSPEAAQRFLNEACAVSHIHHAGIAGVFDVGELADGSHYFLMEYLPGKTLGSRLRRYRTDQLCEQLAPTLRLMEQLAATLTLVHAHGIVHCDLKPENIMIVPDPQMVGGERAVLMDFGIARAISEPEAHSSPSADSLNDASRDGNRMGTPLFMSPEQCRGMRRIDGKADVYAMGVLLFRLCTGQFPFMGRLIEILAKHVAEAPPSPRSWNPALSPELDALIVRMLAKVPELRPTMAEVQARLTSLRVEAESMQATVAVTGSSRAHGLTLKVPVVERFTSRWALATGMLLLTILSCCLSVHLSPERSLLRVVPEQVMQHAEPASVGCSLRSLGLSLGSEVGSSGAELRLSGCKVARRFFDGEGRSFGVLEREAKLPQDPRAHALLCS